MPSAPFGILEMRRRPGGLVAVSSKQAVLCGIDPQTTAKKISRTMAASGVAVHRPFYRSTVLIQTAIGKGPA